MKVIGELSHKSGISFCYEMYSLRCCVHEYNVTQKQSLAHCDIIAYVTFKNASGFKHRPFPAVESKQLIHCSGSP